MDGLTKKKKRTQFFRRISISRYRSYASDKCDRTAVTGQVQDKVLLPLADQLSSDDTAYSTLVKFNLHLSENACGPGSVVGIATGYGLDGPGIESR